MKRELYPSQFITTQAVIINRLAETAFYAKLRNGKQVVAFIERKNAHLRDLLKAEDIVDVTICPSDFNRARVDRLAAPLNEG